MTPYGRLHWRAAIFALISAVPIRAQCHDWLTPFTAPGIVGDVYCSTTFDDGSGLALYVGGAFSAVGGMPAICIARWDGSTWSTVGGGTIVGVAIRDMVVFDDGNGPVLYVAGSFTSIGGGAASRIAKWNGSTWSTLGSGLNGTATSLAVLDDGTGPALFVGGGFSTAGGVSANHIAKWNGVTWSAVGAGVNIGIEALAVFDDGAGPRLYAGGSGAGNIARWDGVQWSAVGSGVGSIVSAMAVYDDGTGDALYVGGIFSTAGGVAASRVAKWNGATWSALGVGVGDDVLALTVYDDGTGPALFAGGLFVTAGGSSANRVAKWNGSNWSALGDGIHAAVTSYVGIEVNILDVFDLGSGPRLLAGGSFSTAGQSGAHSIATWDGTSWSGLVDGNGGAAGPSQVFDDGSGPALFVGGGFVTAGTLPANAIAKWNGTTWSTLGSGLAFDPGQSAAYVNALTVFDDGSGPALFVGGGFEYAGGTTVNHIARWDGASWSPLGSGASAVVRALAVFDDGTGPALYAGGSFTTIGGVPANAIARWDGATWTPLGSGVQFPSIESLIVFDDGSGAALYAAGTFSSAGGVPASRIARWDGAAWSALSSGSSSGTISAMEVFDDGDGPALYVGGHLGQLHGVSMSGIGKWDGASWSQVGGGVSGTGVRSLRVFDDGYGPALYVAGPFSLAGGVSINHIAKWDGSQWSALGAGLNSADSLGAFDDDLDGTEDLYVSTGSVVAGTQVSGFTIWRGCACTVESYCTAGTTTNGCTPTISANGWPSIAQTSGFTIEVADVEGQKQGLLFYGVSGAHDASWGAGSTSYLCVKSPTQRMPTQSSGGSAGQCDGALATDWLDYLATHPTALGQPFSAGASVWCQAWFRDPPSPKTTNLSNGLLFTTCP